MNLYFVGSRVPLDPCGFDVEIAFADFDPTTVTAVSGEMYSAAGGSPTVLACTFNATSTKLTVHHRWQPGELPAVVARYELVAIITAAGKTFSWPCKPIVMHDGLSEGA